MKQGFFEQIKQVYRASMKKRDIFWNTYVARPAAAALVFILAKTPITPNQVSFLGALVFLGVMACLAFWHHPWSMVVAAVILQLSYILDCADGQLARLTGQTSPVGAYLDFLIDEFKALGLVAACCYRLWAQTQQTLWLFVAIGGLIVVSMATSLTTFVRRPAYAGQEIKPGVQPKREIPKSLIGKILWAVESLAKWLIHYPSWFLYVALIDALTPVDGTVWFLGLFLGVYMVYTGRTGLAVFVKLASPGFYKEKSTE